ncbi:helix-turn-helix domain-containing protein [Variovorax sp. dw_954]|uniref:winged helix-turn-helix transcriptional regulator n=1 Tax=Variovorax sp. dw_954 TaxID=2720078 RepID=UPI001BD3D571|nr:helix-turn-helix domain-containing protein [Variovorax sp. dw_954]
MKSTEAAAIAKPGTLADVIRRGELLSAECPSREVLKHVTSRWGVLLLVVLLGGTHRFSELRRKIGGVSEKMLAQTLKWLETDGLVLRKSYPTVPPHVEYTLTPLGLEVGRRVESLADWIEFNLPRIMEARREEPAVAEPMEARMS